MLIKEEIKGMLEPVSNYKICHIFTFIMLRVSEFKTSLIIFDYRCPM